MRSFFIGFDKMINMNELHCFTEGSVTRSPTGTGLLNGLSFAVKDLCAIKGHVSSFGHSQWRKTHSPAKKNSSIVDTLLSEGSELVGTTKMDQLAYSIIGNIGEGTAPVNSKYPERFCGGSSSGSASAVAGGVVDFAIGSDTGGSIRIPAAACGIYGIRTTYDLIPKDGVIELANSADALGFFARSADMLKRVTAVFTDPSRGKIKFKKLLIPNNLPDYTDLGVEALKNEAIRLAKKHSLVIEEVDISKFVSGEVKDMFARNQSREIWKAHGEWIEENKSYLDDGVQARLDNCKRLSEDDKAVIRKDKNAYTQYGKDLQKFIGKGSILCLPILPVSGPNRNWSNEELLNFRSRAFMLIPPASVSGLPQVSAPIVGASTNIGLIGPKYSDVQLIDLLCN